MIFYNGKKFGKLTLVIIMQQRAHIILRHKTREKKFIAQLCIQFPFCNEI